MVIVWSRWPMTTDWLAEAGSVCASPTCSALTWHGPTPTRCSTPPLSAHAPDAEIVTARPDDAVADTVTGSEA